MTTNKPEVAAWEIRICSEPEWEAGVSSKYPEWAEWGEDLNIVPLVRLSDYEALRTECEKLVEALSALRGCIMETRGPDAHSALELADAALTTYHNGASHD